MLSSGISSGAAWAGLRGRAVGLRRVVFERWHLRRAGGDGGFIRVHIPMILRRAVTMLPALIILAIGANPSDALVLSQVVLSFGIPLALVPLVILTGRRDVMGTHANGWKVSALAYLIAGAITAMNCSWSAPSGSAEYAVASDGPARPAVRRYRRLPVG